MIYEFLRKNIKIFVLNSSSYENEEKIDKKLQGAKRQCH